MTTAAGTVKPPPTVWATLVRNWSPVLLPSAAMGGLRASGLWHDTLELPVMLEGVLAERAGVDGAVAALRDRGVRRIVVTGNGAAWYVGHALYLAALHGEPGPEVIALPGGLVAQGRFRFREGDRLLAISSSGEFRDVVEAIEGGAPRPVVAITATADSSVGRLADAAVVQRVLHQRGITHTQALGGALLLGLSIWAELTGDDSLRRAVEDGPRAARAAIEATESWLPSLAGIAVPPAAIAFGGGPAWASALEAALLLKEVARIPCEGSETREGATSSMFGLRPGDLVVSIPTRGDDAIEEAERLCAAAGGVVVRCPGAGDADPRLALLTALPSTVALAGVLAATAGRDIDKPEWAAAYYTTARGAADPASA